MPESRADQTGEAGKSERTRRGGHITMNSVLRLRCESAGMPLEISNTKRWEWLNDNHTIFGPRKDSNEFTLDEAPDWLRCPACWGSYAGLGQVRSTHRPRERPNIVTRYFSCTECGTRWHIDFAPQDFMIKGQYYSLPEIIRFELRYVSEFNDRKRRQQKALGS